MLLFSSPCYNYSLFYVSGECLRGYTTNKNFGFHSLLLCFNFTYMPMKKKNPKNILKWKQWSFVIFSHTPPPKKNVWQLDLFLKKWFYRSWKIYLLSIWDKGREHNSFVSTLSLNIDSSLANIIFSIKNRCVKSITYVNTGVIVLR